MSAIIRPAERRDLPAVGRLGAMLIETHYAFDRQRFLAPTADTAAGYAWFLGNVLESAGGTVFVAEADGEIAGYTYIAIEPLSWKELRGPAGFIHDVAVREDMRRTGIGRQLMARSIEWLHEHGAPRVILWTAAPNAVARHLFQEMGFRDTMVEMTLERVDG